MARVSGRSAVEGVLLDWSIDQPTAPRTLPVQLLSKAQIAAELTRVQARRAMDTAYEAELILGLAAHTPDRFDPPPGSPGARTDWGGGGELPGVSEFFPAELAMVRGAGRGTARFRAARAFTWREQTGCPEHPDADPDVTDDAAAGADAGAADTECCDCPVLGTPPATDAYPPTEKQRLFVTTRDRTCRMPNCGQRTGWADLDHVIPHACGGATTCTNLCGLCRSHHRLKTFARGWAFRMDPDGTLHVTTPSGITRTTRPPGMRPPPEPPPEGGVDDGQILNGCDARKVNGCWQLRPRFRQRF